MRDEFSDIGVAGSPTRIPNSLSVHGHVKLKQLASLRRKRYVTIIKKTTSEVEDEDVEGSRTGLIFTDLNCVVIFKVGTERRISA